MHPTVKRLLDSFRQLLATPDLAAGGTAGSSDQPSPDVGEAAALFADLFGMPCPLSLQPGLLLPSAVSVTWQYSRDVSGEVQLSNLLSSMHRTLDASLLNVTVDGHLLGDMRIADAVLDNAGPLHTLFEVRDGRISEQLFLFDSRELRRIELSYDAYLDMAAATRGIVYWQYLFCERRVTPGMAQVLSAELEFLEARFPEPELDTLRRRLRERSA
jgi:hypothetical protein